jgi:hypothetical protein
MRLDGAAWPANYLSSLNQTSVLFVWLIKPPASTTFLSEQISHQQSAKRTDRNPRAADRAAGCLLALTSDTHVSFFVFGLMSVWINLMVAL